MPIHPAFETHRNYIKRLASHLNGCSFEVFNIGSHALDEVKIKAYKKLFEVTNKSIEEDMRLAQDQPDFARIALPWLPVKCYYALYYLESMLLHRIDGSQAGFSKGGHKKVRDRLRQLLAEGKILFSEPELNRSLILYEARKLQSIAPGANTSRAFWRNNQCDESIFKKLAEYSAQDIKFSNKYNLKIPKQRKAYEERTKVESIALIDLFYWYRIKANYRDMDYIDYENDIDISDVTDYMSTYYQAYVLYRDLLMK